MKEIKEVYIWHPMPNGKWRIDKFIKKHVVNDIDENQKNI